MRHRRRSSVLPTRIHRSIVSLATVGLLASGTLAAPGAIEGAEIAVEDTGILSWFVEDEAGSAVHSTVFEVSGPDGWSLQVGDNLSGDTNTTQGAVTITGLPTGEFTITPQDSPEGFELGEAQNAVVTGDGQEAEKPITFVATPVVEEGTEEPAPAEGGEGFAPIEKTEAPIGATFEAEKEDDASLEAEVPADTAAGAASGSTGPVTDGTRQSRFAPSAAPTPSPMSNPALPQVCGLDIAIVLDLSNSLSDRDVEASRDAATDFVNVLQGTPSSVGVYTFATFAPDRTNLQLGKTSIATAGGAGQVRDHIANLQRVPTNVGGTNWDTGFSQIPTSEYDVIVFITDGNPTAYGVPGTGRNNDYGSSVDQIDINRGTESSNAHKAAGTFVIGLGVGEVDAANIRYISGTRLNTDYYLMDKYDELAAALEEIALRNCAGTLTVVKQVRALDGTLSPGQDWTFSTSDGEVSPTSTQTDVNGAVNFDVDGYSDAITSRDITVTETQQPGFSLEQQEGANAVCTNTANGQTVTATNAGQHGFTVPVPRDGAISCQVINTVHPTVSLQKEWVDGLPGDSAMLTIDGEPTSPAVVSEVGETPTFTDTDNIVTVPVAPGETVEVAEVLDAEGSYVTTLSCEGVTPDYTDGESSGSFTMPAGGNVLCTFTNSLELEDLTVSKTVNTSYDRAYTWNIEKTADADRIEVPAGESATFDYDVEVTAEGRLDSRVRVKGEITVSNTNPVAFSGVDVADQLPGAECTVTGGTDLTVDANSSTTVSYECTAESIDGVGDTNTATATWDVADYPGTSGAASGAEDVEFGAPESETDRYVTVTDEFDGGGPVLLLLPDDAEALDWEDLGAGNSVTLDYSQTVTGQAGACVDILNRATVNGDDGELESSSELVSICTGVDLVVSKNVVHSYDRTYSYDIAKSVDAEQKSVDPQTGETTFDYTVTVTDGPAADSNWEMSGTITVTNPNAWLDITAEVTDQVDIGGGAECTVTDGASALIIAGGTTEFGYTCAFAEQPTYDGTNTATVIWNESVPTPDTSASGTANVKADEWDVTPINQTVTVVDDQTDPANPVVLGEHTWTEQGATEDFTYQLTLEGTEGACVDFTNNAWIDELPDVTIDQDVTACWPVDLEVAKTVEATYDTEYSWDLTKEVDRTAVTITEDGTAEFTYVVTAVPAGSQDANWTMTGEITVTNPNSTEVTVDVTDSPEDLGEGVTCTVEDPELTVPGSDEARTAYSCTFDGQPTYVGGSNTAAVTWTDANGDQQSVSSDAEPVEFVQEGQTNLDVQVWDDKVTGEAPGELLGTAYWDEGPTAFEYTLDLPGEAGECVAHTNTAVIPKTGDQAEETVTVCIELGPEVAKDAAATYDREYLWGITKMADRSEVTIGEGGNAEFTYVVSATPGDVTDSNWAMDGQIMVTNPNGFEGGDLTVTVTDEATVGGSCAVEGGEDVTLFPGQVVTLDYTCAFEEQPEYAGTNTATAVWTDAAGEEQSATGETEVAFALDGETNRTVDVYDDKVTGEAPGELLGEAEWNAEGTVTEFDYLMEFDGVAGACTDYTNTAVIPATGDDTEETVTVCVEAGPEVSKTAEADFDREYFWTLEKETDLTDVTITEHEATFNYVVTATPNGSEDSNWAMTGQVEVTNPNNFEDGGLTVTVTDVPDVGGECVVEDGVDAVVAPGETRSFDYSCTFEEQPQYEGSNTATVAWETDTGLTGSAAADAEVTFDVGRETNAEVEVFDNKVLQEGDGVSLGTANWHDGITEFPYELTLPGAPGQCVDHTNTAVIPATGDDAYAQVTICVEDELVITKSAEASYDREYLWDITKEADETVLTIGEDGTATFDYTVTATPDPEWVDSGWEMDGQISVTNPNEYAEGTVTATVTDETTVGGTCVVTDGEDVVLDPGETRVFDYSCSFSEQPEYEGTNTATVAWTGPEATERTSSFDHPVTFERAQTFHEVVEIHDDKVTGEAPGERIGTATWNPDGTPEVVEYSLSLPGHAGACIKHTNTAILLDPDDEAQETVTVCSTAAPEVDKTVVADFDRTYDWSISKEVDRTRVVLTQDGTAQFNYVVSATADGYADSDWTMSGVVSVTNPNTFEGGELTVTVTDVPSVGGECTVADGQGIIVAPAETRTFDYTCTFEEEPEYAGTNLASVAWSGPGETSGTTTAEAEVDFLLDEETTLDVEVYDDKVTGEAPGELLGIANWHDGVTEFAYSLDLPGEVGSCVDYTNTAVLQPMSDAMADLAVGDQAQAEVTVCIEEAPEVSKTADASYDRSYEWSLAKEADRTSVELPEPGIAEFSYVVSATPDGYTDSGWAMSGEVTVTNPNDFQELAVTVTDEATVGGRCVVADGEDVVLAAGETRTLGYECTFEEQPAYEGSNTAVVTWTDVEGAEQKTSSEAVDVSFEVDEETNLVVEVFDNMVTGDAPGELLGTADWRHGPTEFAYGLELAGVVDRCVDYTNTAVIPTTDDEAQETVEVCVAAPEEPTPPVEPPVDPPAPVDPVDPVVPPVSPVDPADPVTPVIPTGDPVASGPQVALVLTGLTAMILALLGAALFMRRRQD